MASSSGDNKGTRSRGQQYALIVTRSGYDQKTVALDTLKGVAPTARNVAVDLVRQGFMVVVVADTPMALPQGAFDNGTLEQQYIDDGAQAEKARRLLWQSGGATRANIRAGVCALASMVPGHVAATNDELVVYIAAHGQENASDRSYGAALADIQCVHQTTDGDGHGAPLYEGAYTMHQLHDDLGVDREQRWRNTLVVLDTCHSGAAFDMPQQQRVCARARGVGETAAFQTLYLAESFHCLAAAPSRYPAFCADSGTVLYAALRRAWLSPDGDSGAFGRGGGEGAAEWATIGCVADRVNVELAKVMRDGPDFLLHRQTCALGRLGWRVDANVGEFVVFNKNYTERNKLAMVPTRPDCFTGRVAQLAELHSRLMSDGQAMIGNNVAVRAAGGVGKSALAAVYATEHVNDYTWLLWVRGTNAGTMVGSFREAAAYIPLRGVTKTSKDEEVVAAMRQWLSHVKGWLMVVDGWDAVTEEMVKMMPRGQMGGKVIVTTRLQNVREFGTLFGGGGGEHVALSLDVLEEEDAVAYLLERLPLRKEAERETLREVALALGGMPLALELASGYLGEMEHTSASVYLKRLGGDRLKVLRERTGDGQLVDRVLATYRPSIERAMEIGGEKMVKKIAGVMGLVEGSGIEVELLRLLVEGKKREVGEEEEADGVDEFDVALLFLCRLSVVKRTGMRVSVHELVQDVCRATAFDDEEERWKSVMRVGMVLQEEIDDKENMYTKMEWSREVGVHGMRCLERMVKRGRKDDDAVWLGVRLSGLWRLNGRYAEAKRAIEMGIACVGDEESVTGASAFGAMASVLNDQGEFGHAMQYYERALTICEKSVGPDHPFTGQTLNNMAGVFEAQGDYSRALEYYERALTIREKSVGPDHPSTGGTLNNMAGVFEAQGHYSRALEYYKRALTICEKSLGLDHPSRGDALNNMAGVCQAQGDYSRALEYYELALTIREKSVGPDLSSTGDTLNNMAGVFKAQGHYSRALEYYERALTIYENLVGAMDSRVAIVVESMASLFLAQRHRTKTRVGYTVREFADRRAFLRCLERLCLVFRRQDDFLFVPMLLPDSVTSSETSVRHPIDVFLFQFDQESDAAIPVTLTTFHVIMVQLWRQSKSGSPSSATQRNTGLIEMEGYVPFQMRLNPNESFVRIEVMDDSDAERVQHTLERVVSIVCDDTQSAPQGWRGYLELIPAHPYIQDAPLYAPQFYSSFSDWFGQKELWRSELAPFGAAKRLCNQRLEEWCPCIPISFISLKETNARKPYTHAAALVVGISKYQNSNNTALAIYPDLGGVEASVERMSQMWRSRGFEVRSVIDVVGQGQHTPVTEKRIRDALFEIAEVFGLAVDKNVLLIVHLIGHGVAGQPGGLVLSDACLPPGSDRVSCFNLSTLRGILEGQLGWRGCNFCVIGDFCNSGSLVEVDLGEDMLPIARVGYARQMLASALEHANAYMTDDASQTRLTELLTRALGPTLEVFRPTEQSLTLRELRRRLSELGDMFSARKVGRIWLEWGGTANTGDIVFYREGNGVGQHI